MFIMHSQMVYVLNGYRSYDEILQNKLYSKSTNKWKVNLANVAMHDHNGISNKSFFINLKT